MIVVKIELWPKGDQTKSRELGRTYISNVGGTAKRGDYNVRVCRKGAFEPPINDIIDGKGFTRTAKVENYPRLSYNVWRLVCRALRAAFPEEKGDS